MTLLEAIIAFGMANITDTNDWYQWKINPNFLPIGIILPRGNHYTQNVFLKVQLSKLYLSADDRTRQEIINYYISKWGGIRKNSIENIRDYALDSPESLIARGSQGIASWSKALCIRYPSEYAIYDARVAMSLNCLQVIHQVILPMIFPLLRSQNTLITSRKKTVCLYASAHGWAISQECAFYRQYNRLLSSAALSIGTYLYTLEMLLFAKAIDLLNEAFPDNR